MTTLTPALSNLAVALSKYVIEHRCSFAEAAQALNASVPRSRCTGSGDVDQNTYEEH